MHGISRKSATPVDDKKSVLTAAVLRSLQSQLLYNHHNNIYTKEALDSNAELVKKNPDFMTAWNYRKLAFQYNLDTVNADLNHIIDEELKVVEEVLNINPKSYGAWYHRKWVLSKGNTSTKHELELLNLLLSQKEGARNFHAWNYRRFIAGFKNISDEKELQFTTDMINHDFSNYSAWHNRSVLLSRLLKKKVKGYFPKEKFLSEEFDFVRSAVFTDPNDQCGWFYHLWLLDQTIKVHTNVNMMPLLTSLIWMTEMIDKEIYHYRTLLSPVVTKSEKDERSRGLFLSKTNALWLAEADNMINLAAIKKEEEAKCKIAMLTLARLLMAYDAMISTNTPAILKKVLKLYSQLMKLDPPHYQYYKDEHSLVLLKQITSSNESLLKYCSEHKDSGSLWLRLNSLSLSRIGCFERLLWVQNLDLSHNQLHSIEGLEALHLLTCLNLSHNKLGSFTVLDPLRLLKSLRLLDISYNEIGAHIVDTRRYLCLSPLSHTLVYDKDFEDFATDDAKVVNFWEAYSIFRGLKIMQLDIMGNIAVDERFMLFLVKLLPGLQWLDGKKLN
ncbi:geranylgeranyl transferase type-2 subunit alpha 1-like [Rutidosis leptorrhynchoides]|uniref:geranylgeranyl transferase type-2 subunit alpha 1-like n=1 Tax=Rutidosis leptorrhynchoides TaxID=125765 RepID=UPI003A98EA15